MLGINEAMHQTVEAAAADGACSVLAGIDRVELAEFQRTVEVAGQPFLDRVFTPGELAFAARRIERLADRFAAKEAVAKVLGTGFRGLAPSEIEIETSAQGRPSVRLIGRAKKRAEAVGLRSLAVSMTNTSLYSEALAVGLCNHLSENLSTSKESEHG